MERDHDVVGQPAVLPDRGAWQRSVGGGASLVHRIAEAFFPAGALGAGAAAAFNPVPIKRRIARALDDSSGRWRRRTVRVLLPHLVRRFQETTTITTHPNSAP